MKRGGGKVEFYLPKELENAVTNINPSKVGKGGDDDRSDKGSKTTPGASSSGYPARSNGVPKNESQVQQEESSPLTLPGVDSAHRMSDSSLKRSDAHSPFAHAILPVPYLCTFHFLDLYTFT